MPRVTQSVEADPGLSPTSFELQIPACLPGPPVCAAVQFQVILKRGAVGSTPFPTAHSGGRLLCFSWFSVNGAFEKVALGARF